MTDPGAVHPYRRSVIDGTETQKQPLSRRRGAELDTAPVPAPAIESGVAHAARNCFGREGDANAILPFHLRRNGPAGGWVDRELPVAVEGVPCVPAQLWPRVAAPAVIERIRAELRKHHEVGWKVQTPFSP